VPENSPHACTSLGLGILESSTASWPPQGPIIASLLADECRMGDFTRPCLGKVTAWDKDPMSSLLVLSEDRPMPSASPRERGLATHVSLVSHCETVD
jgi:hypothetical protein